MGARQVVAWNLRRLRSELRVSQEALAADAAVDRSYEGRVERGLENPTVDMLERLATALGCDIRDFFLPIDSKNPPKPLKAGRKPKGKTPR
jgi:transcriptional regulator with XRE-family HTH domain